MQPPRRGLPLIGSDENATLSFPMVIRSGCSCHPHHRHNPPSVFSRFCQGWRTEPNHNICFLGLLFSQIVLSSGSKQFILLQCGLWNSVLHTKCPEAYFIYSFFEYFREKLPIIQHLASDIAPGNL